MNETKLAGRYVLVETIAAGGMGTVHKATDERLSRTVAVKMLRDDLAGDPRFVERFRREARAVAALSHPNIAGVYDYGEEDNHYFFVMEFIDGKDLSQLMRVESPFSQERAALIAAGTLDALQHAHSAGVIHRDIKPANIIVTKRERSAGSTGPQEKVKVTDFGIARAVGDATLTATGSVLGTAHYLSPEQASGGTTGPTTDQYSTGIVLYEMLVGAVPFTGDSPVAIAMRHLSDELPPPSAVNPDISPGLDAIVRRATSKDALDRFPDAQAMADALRHALDSRQAGGLVGGAAGAALGGSTAVLGGTTERTAERPLSGEWDAQRVGRTVLLSFAALIVIAIALLVFRLASGDEEPQRSERQRDPGAAGQPAEEEPLATGVVPDDILGRSFDDVSDELTNELGLNVEENPAPSNEYPDPGDVSGAVPAPGSTVTEGDTITLTVSTGPEDPEEDEDEDDDDDEDDQPGGPPPGKGPDKVKPPKDGD
ncbi:MAG TPA: protein kinase [Actinomycetota bacterium]|nr:protein kinase [Actinomycetota bacterium]